MWNKRCSFIIVFNVYCSLRIIHNTHTFIQFLTKINHFALFINISIKQKLIKQKSLDNHFTHIFCVIIYSIFNENQPLCTILYYINQAEITWQPFYAACAKTSTQENISCSDFKKIKRYLFNFSFLESYYFGWWRTIWS